MRSGTCARRTTRSSSARRWVRAPESNIGDHQSAASWVTAADTLERRRLNVLPAGRPLPPICHPWRHNLAIRRSGPAAQARSRPFPTTHRRTNRTGPMAPNIGTPERCWQQPSLLSDIQVPSIAVTRAHETPFTDMTTTRKIATTRRWPPVFRTFAQTGRIRRRVIQLHNLPVNVRSATTHPSCSPDQSHRVPIGLRLRGGQAPTLFSHVPFPSIESPPGGCPPRPRRRRDPYPPTLFRRAVNPDPSPRTPDRAQLWNTPLAQPAHVRGVPHAVLAKQVRLSARHAEKRLDFREHERLEGNLAHECEQLTRRGHPHRPAASVPACNETGVAQRACAKAPRVHSGAIKEVLDHAAKGLL